jgi:DNA-binding response OmpR family regulator
MSNHHCPSCGYQLRNFETIRYGNVQIDPPGKITFSAQEIELAPTQFILVDALIRAKGRGVYRSTLANLIDPDLSEQAITVYIRRLREAFRRFEPSFDQIECIRGFAAYRWVAVSVN